MTLATKTLAAALVAGSLPLLAGAASAAPLKGLTNDKATVQNVQYRDWRGPGFGVGVTIGAPGYDSYYDGAYDAYAAAPGWRAGPSWRRDGARIRNTPAYSPCAGDRYQSSAWADEDRCR